MRRKEIMAGNPQIAAIHRLHQRMRSQRRRAAMSEAQLEEARALARRRYAGNADEVLRRRNTRRRQETVQQREERLAKARAYWLKIREEVNALRKEARQADPEAWNAYARYRWQERRRMRALAQMASIGDALNKKLKG